MNIRSLATDLARDLRDYCTHVDAMNSRALSSEDVFEFLETVMMGIIWPSAQIERTLQLGIFDPYEMWDQLRELAGNLLPEGHIEQPFFHGWHLGGEQHMFYCPFTSVDNAKFLNTDEQMGRSPGNGRTSSSTEPSDSILIENQRGHRFNLEPA